MKNTQEQNKPEQTKGCYLCTFGVLYQGFGTGTMLQAYVRLMNGTKTIREDLRKLGWDVRDVTFDSDGHYFNKVFYDTYEAKMTGIKSKDIPRGTLEKIASKQEMKLLDCA